MRVELFSRQGGAKSPCRWGSRCEIYRDEARNTENAIRYCRFAVDSGAIPLAPHLFLPSFMSEAEERDEAMFMNMVFLGKCEQLWVFGDKITAGMAAEIAKAEKRQMPIRYFNEDCEEKVNVKSN